MDPGFGYHLMCASLPSFSSVSLFSLFSLDCLLFLSIRAYFSRSLICLLFTYHYMMYVLSVYIH